jgi:hypothetical protein
MDSRSMPRLFGRQGERGQVLPLAGLAMFVLLGAAAMAVDVGYLRYRSGILAE